ncbi:hypothetical protein SKAU_G00201310 [Synaphobranchus kaupii]|uniref:LIM zinc-binding domain-containing protein n=1 Tax=Synaphobranchus kaupii TaxID=118154 RepID=A0A9Q1IW45_SYNKA|nr:hypothetical protein SKAU_G00201310 [Synaphobranchus kaupii]
MEYSPPIDGCRCSSCGENVVGEGTGCTAMDQVFHVDCFTCTTCGSKLRGKPFYAMEKKAYCEPCYVNTLETCSVCSQPIMERILRATGKAYHPHCFSCVVCHRSLDGIPFTVDAANQIHCIEDFHKKFAPPLLGVWGAHHARPGTGGDGAHRGAGPGLPRAVLPLRGLWLSTL